jgi:hypothetical protein
MTLIVKPGEATLARESATGVADLMELSSESAERVSACGVQAPAPAEEVACSCLVESGSYFRAKVSFSPSQRVIQGFCFQRAQPAHQRAFHRTGGGDHLPPQSRELLSMFASGAMPDDLTYGIEEAVSLADEAIQVR